MSNYSCQWLHFAAHLKLLSSLLFATVSAETLYNAKHIWEAKHAQYCGTISSRPNEPLL